MLIRTKSRLTVVELGAGKAIPTVRNRAERTAASAAASGGRSAGSLIRINPEPAAAAVPPGVGVALRVGALAALSAIDARLPYLTQPRPDRVGVGEVILEIGAEGGSLTIVGIKAADG
jgi:hypothetical protein